MKPRTYRWAAALWLACGLAAALPALADATPFGTLVVEPGPAGPVRTEVVRQRWNLPWLHEALRAYGDTIARPVVLVAPGTLGAPVYKITSIPGMGAGGAPDYLVREELCSVVAAPEPGRKPDEADVMSFDCKGLDVGHLLRQRQSCHDEGGTWDLSPMFPKGRCFPMTRARCQADNGTWLRVGLSRELNCLIALPDANKPCTHAAQCRGRVCLHVGNPPGADGRITGACKATSGPLVGCIRTISDGRVDPEVCID